MHVLVVVLANWGILLPLLLVALAIALRRHWALDMTDAAAGGVLTVVFTKIAGLHYEARPFIIEHVRPLVSHAADNAFPSDHLAAIGLACAFLWPRSRALAAVSAAAGVAVAWARVSARVHWPLDVVVGFFIGLGAMAIAAYGTTRIRTRWSRDLRNPASSS